MSVPINDLIKKYYKINNNYKNLIYQANRIKLNLDKEVLILKDIINNINEIIYKYYEKKLTQEENQKFKDLLYILNDIYNLIYQKILCYG